MTGSDRRTKSGADLPGASDIPDSSGTPVPPVAPAASLAYLIKLSRPRFWLYLAGPVLVGASFGAERLADFLSPTAILTFIYFLLPANILLYGVNDRFDAPVDAFNPKKDDREARYTGGRLVVGAIVASAIAGLALTLWLPAPARSWLVAFFFLAIGYSAPPLRFKTRPLADSLSNGLYILPGIAIYAALAGAHPPWAAIAAGWLWTMAMHTFSAIPDIEPDRQAGIATTATWLGRRGSFAYCGACWLAAALLFALLSPALGLLFLVYPALDLWAARLPEAELVRAYWWFPAINTFVGMALTLAGLLQLSFG
jgi:4-hydroxybenzoate polyprenyltransferase